MTRLAGKTSLVTGATSGIGRAVAERLAGEGAQVILSGRDLDRGEQVVAAIRSSGGSACFVRADLAKFEDVKRLAAESGQADILVNNAGVFPFGPTSETGEEAFDLAFDVNVKAPFFLTAAIAPQMIARGARPAGRDTPGTACRERRADRIGRRVPGIRGRELHLRRRGARRRREGRRLMVRTHAHAGWTTLARTHAPILADLTSSTFAERQKESTWL
jgi:NAD(P)-dependent dehydrogenase (short-subunit alcohol dehydrogenase family)